MTKMKSYRFQMYILQMVEELSERLENQINTTKIIEHCIWERYESVFGPADVDKLVELEKKYKANHPEGKDLPSTT